MIVDTCFIIDIMNNDESALASLDRLEHGAEPIILTSLNVFELYSGIAQSKVPEKEKEKVEAILDTQTVISFEEDDAKKGGYIYGLLQKKGDTIDIMDCMLAGIAKSRIEPILTRNIRHFKKVPGLMVNSY